MKAHINTKREVATLLPYRRIGSGFEFFLQKRSLNAKVDADLFSLFGGGLKKNESIRDALYREIREELNYVPSAPVFFSRYEHAKRINHVFIEEASATLEHDVTVSEGQYGKFLNTDAVRNSQEVALMTKLIVKQVTDMLSKQ